jgi:hypothetical protein
MAIKETEVEITINSGNMNYFEDLGYEIPRELNKRGKMVVPNGTKIAVRVKDLMSGSSAMVTKICDVCGEEAKNPIQYGLLIKGRTLSGGLDTCQKCGINKKRENYIKQVDCLIVTHPHLADMLVIKEDAYNNTHASRNEVAFRCNECNHVFYKKIVNATRYDNGLSCPHCSDGISYPEKFMKSLLVQLEVGFEHQKMFEGWFENGVKKYYDFYLKKLNCIIEVHGRQHYEETFERMGGRVRSLEEEQQNDRDKKAKALEKGIDEELYIVVDARESKIDHLRNSILNSRIGELFDLSNVDWNKCHKDAFKSLVKTVCDEWYNGNRSSKQIAKKLSLDKCTVIKYLKQGSEIGWCDYNANNERNVRAVVQLSLEGEFIKEFESMEKACKEVGISSKGNISTACTGKYSHAGGYRWMYKEVYENLTEEDKLNLRSTKVELVHKKREVYQLDENLNLINMFESIAEARRQTGVRKVGEVCNGKRKVAGGYKWMFKEGYVKSQMSKLC